MSMPTYALIWCAAMLLLALLAIFDVIDAGMMSVMVPVMTVVAMSARQGRCGFRKAGER